MTNEEKLDFTQQLIAFIEERKGLNTIMVDVSQQCNWADYFIISTVTSVAHLRGIVRDLWGFLSEKGIEVRDRHKTPDGDGWELIDCGFVVVHLMSQEFRDFYDLEKLWKKLED